MRKKRFMAFLLSLAMAGTSVYTCGVIDVQAAAVENQEAENPNMMEQLAEEIQAQAADLSGETEDQQLVDPIVDQQMDEPQAQAVGGVTLSANDVAVANNGEVEWGSEVEIKNQTADGACFILNGQTISSGTTYTPTKENFGATITASANGDTTNFKVGKRSIEAAWIDVTPDSAEYTGHPHSPVVSVSDPDYGIEVEGIDYRWNPNGMTEPGGVHVDVNANASDLYKGSVSEDNAYTITQKIITSVNLSLPDATSLPYTGREIEPRVNIRAVSTNPIDVDMVEGTDYTITWTGNKNAGDTPVAAIALKNNGRYKLAGGSTSPVNVLGGFTITKRENATLEGKFAGNPNAEFPQGVSVGDVKKALSVSYDGVAVEQADYTVAKLGSFEDDDILPLGNYTLDITGQGNFAANSTGKVNFSVVAKGLSANDLVVKFVSANDDGTYEVSYNGQEQKPALVVSINETGNEAESTPLKENTDYTVGWESNKDAGTAYAVVTLKAGNYSPKDDVKKVSFNILPISISGNKVEGLVKKKPVYNGGAQRPADSDLVISANLDGNTRNGHEIILEQGKDYTISEASVSQNISANGVLGAPAEYKVRALAKANGNFTGYLDIDYTIEKKSISDNDIEWKSSIKDSYGYTGSAIKPAVKMTYQGLVSSNKTLVSGTDYTPAYGTNTYQGEEAYVEVSGKNNFVGVQRKEFVIGNPALTDVSFDTISYNGRVISVGDLKKVVTVFSDATTLPERNYDIIIDNGAEISEVGEYPVTIQGKNGYTNSLPATVKVVPAKLISSGDGKNVTWGNGHVYKSEKPEDYEEPEVTVSVGDKVFVKGTDYEVVCERANGQTRGKMTVTAKSKNIEGVVSVNFDIVKTDFKDAGIEIVEYNKEFVYNGSAQTPSANDIVVKDTKHNVVLSGGDFYLSGPTNNVNAGTATITVIARGNSNYNGQCAVSFTIKARDLNDAGVTLSANTKTTVSAPYTGEEQALSADNLSTNCLSYNGTYLTPDDYDLVFRKDGKDVEKYTNIGEYSIVAVGKDKNFTGERELGVFKVNPKDLEDRFYLVPEEAQYTGEVIRPSVNATTALYVENRDYTVSYPDNMINKGTYPVVILGSRNYTGSVTKNFEIRGVEINRDNTEVSFSGVSENGQVMIDVRTNGRRLEQGVDYTYTSQSVNGSDPQKWEVTVTAATGGNYEGAVTKEVEFGKIVLEKEDVEVLADVDFTYTGEEQQLKNDQIKVVKGGKVLTEGTDYTVSNPVAATKAGEVTSLSINGIGDYTGVATVEAEIKPIALDPNGVRVVKNVVWTGTAAAPEVEVSVNGVVLTKGTDYTVEVNEYDTEMGTYKATVKGIGNYGGEVLVDYEITAPTLDNATIVEEKLPYTGKVQRPETVTVMLGNQIVPSDQYAISYDNPESTEVGTYGITVSGTDRYTGTAKGTYQIVAVTLDDAKVDVKPVVYTGSKADPEVTVTLGGVTLEKDVDYIVDAGNAINAKNGYNLTIAGIGSYSGEIKATFDIKPATITTSNVKVNIPAVTYNGKAQTPKNPIVIVGSRELKATEYTLAVAKGANNTNAGKVNVTITGKGNYTGTVTGAWFTINRKSISKGTVTGIKDKTYTGKAIAQGVIVTLDGQRLTKSNGALTVTYKNNKNIGPASLTITGRGNYTGTLTGRTFRIFPKKAVMSSLKAGKNRFTVQAKKQGGGVKYQIQYRVKGSKAGYTRIETTNPKRVIKGLRKGKTYTVKVRAYKKVSGRIYYGAFSKAKNVKVK